MQDRTGLRVRRYQILCGLCLMAGAVLWAPEAQGQEASALRIPVSTSAVRAALAANPIARPAASRYDVIALRVEFQPDTTRFTTGEGTFGGVLYEGGLEPTIDPFPHDAAYFEAHLAFLENYVERVSNGRTDVTTHLLPEVVRVSRPMGAYAPTGFEAGSDAELSKLAALIPEAWSLADASLAFDATDFNPETTAFLIFHAGIGRDIELVGTTLDKTPEDLPSIFLGSEALQRLQPGVTATFAGIPVEHGMLVPRTQSRRAIDPFTDEPFLAEFSMNGMLAASFFNYLGVPDLFNTETGESAIGPFGLMDGLGIFAMSGLFPPEPSAWTRVYLGWEDPVEVSGDRAGIELPHAGGNSPQSVLRVPISSREYFLVENRNRDPLSDGVRMQVWQEGSIEEVVFANDDETFNPVSVAGFPGGVVVSVDTYDFALPGGVDEDNNALVGGALIWHIDERRLADGLASNGVNADPGARAIDVEEADGAQDIGNPSGGFFGPQFELGSPFDFWYQGNPVVVVTATGQEIRLYQNRFGTGTQPASLTNEGGASFVEIEGFSVPGPAMTVNVRRTETGGMRPVDSSFRLGGNSLLSLEGGMVQPLEQLDGIMLWGRSNEGGHVGASFGDVGAGPVETGTAEPAVGPDGYVRYAGVVDSEMPFAVRLPVDIDESVALTTPVVASPGQADHFALGLTRPGGPRLVQVVGSQVVETHEPEPVVSLAVTDRGDLIVAGTTQARLEAEGLVWAYAPLDPGVTHRPMFGRDRRGVFGAVAATGLHLLQPDGTVVTVLHGTTVAPHAAVYDLDGDALLDALVVAGSQIWGFHRTGAVVDGFPIELHAEMGSGQPLVTRAFEPSGLVIVVGLADGTLDARDLSNEGRRLEGFPLSVGAGPVGTPLVHGGRITAMDANGRMRQWQVDRPLSPAMHLVDVQNTSFVDMSVGIGPPCVLDDSCPTELLVDSETYNWPNPVRGSITHFRYEVSETAEVTVRVLDMSGRKVAELDAGTVHPGTPAEVVWEAQVANGLYYARVRARSMSGRSQDRLIKVAVLR